MTAIAADGRDFSVEDVCTFSSKKDPMILTDIVLDSSATNLFEKFGCVYTFECQVSIEKMISTGIVGLNIDIAGRTADESIIVPVLFKDNFPELMETGEKDSKSLLDSLKHVRTKIVNLSDANGDGVVSVTELKKSLKFTIGTVNGNMTDAVKQGLVGTGKPIDEILGGLNRPSFPLPSEMYANSNIGGSSNTIVIDYTDILEKTSIKELRDELAVNTDNHDNVSFSKAMLATKEQDRKDSLQLGSLVRYTTDKFLCQRKIIIGNDVVNPAADMRISLSPIIDDDFSIDIYSVPTSFSINNNELYEEIMTPSEKPDMRILANTPGTIRLEVGKGDPTTTEARVFLKYYHPIGGTIINGPTKTVYFGAKNNKKVVDFRAIHNVPPLVTQVTVAPISSVGQGPQATTKVFSPIKYNPYLSDNSMGNPDNVVITCYNNNEGIVVSVTGLPDNTSGVQVCRENMFVSKDSAQRESLVYESSSNTVISFVDTNVIPEKLYRYFVKVSCLAPVRESYLEQGHNDSNEFMFSVCEEEQALRIMSSYIASKDAKIKRKAIHPLPGWKFNFSNPVSKFSSIPGETEVYIEVTAEQNGTNPSGIDEVTNLLKSINLEDIYEESISESASAYSTRVPVYLVERTSLTTGEKAFLGSARVNDTFKDPSIISPFDKYRYIFRLCAISPEALIEFASSTIKSEKQISGDETHQIDSKKFTSLATGLTGILLSNSEITNMSIVELLNLNDTGKRTIIDYDPTPQLSGTTTTAFSALVGTDFGYRYSIKWSVSQSAVSSIHMFFVYCVYQGVTNLLTTITASPTQDTYYCYDVVYAMEVGRKEYFIIPFTNNLGFGPKSASIDVLTPSSVEEAWDVSGGVGSGQDNLGSGFGSESFTDKVPGFGQIY